MSSLIFFLKLGYPGSKEFKIICTPELHTIIRVMKRNTSFVVITTQVREARGAKKDGDYTPQTRAAEVQ